MNPLGSGWRIQRDVVFALFIREMKTRFGKFRLGYLWAILEPLSFVLILSMIRMFFNNRGIGGIDHPVFYATGIMPFLFFQHCVNVCLHAVDSNIGLFNYQRVRPIDAVLARVLLEVSIMMATALLVAGVLCLLGFQIRLDDPLGFLLTMLLLGLFSLGIGLGLSVLGGLSNEVQKITPILIRPLFFISGIFFMISNIPQPFQDYLLLNPILHQIELCRSNMYCDYKTPVNGFSYLAICTLVVAFTGLASSHIYRRKVTTSGTK